MHELYCQKPDFIEDRDGVKDCKSKDFKTDCNTDHKIPPEDSQLYI